MIILTPNGKYKFEARDNDPDDEAVVKETWVEDVYDIHRGILDDTGIVIDLGANIGAVSVYCASLDEGNKDKPRVTVYAVEPEPNNLSLLRKNIELNGMDKKITVVPKAVWGSRTTLYVNNGSGGTTTVTKDEAQGKDRLAVEAVRLEDIYADNKITACDLLKIDVEGAEYEILLKCPDAILTKAAHIRIEFDERTTDEQFGALMVKLCKHFNVHVIGSPDRGGNIYADRY